MPRDAAPQEGRAAARPTGRETEPGPPGGPAGGEQQQEPGTPPACQAPHGVTAFGSGGEGDSISLPVLFRPLLHLTSYAHAITAES